ncbi:unnamed protein product, partial [Rotaria sp. Silwood2]
MIVIDTSLSDPSRSSKSWSNETTNHFHLDSSDISLIENVSIVNSSSQIQDTYRYDQMILENNNAPLDLLPSPVDLILNRFDADNYFDLVLLAKPWYCDRLQCCSRLQNSIIGVI